MKRVLVVLGLACLTLAAPLRGQCTGNTWNDVQAPAPFAFSNPGDPEFMAGATVYPTAGTYQWWGFAFGARYTVCIRANTIDLGVSTSGTYHKPLATLEYKLSTEADTQYRPITQTWQPIQTGTFTIVGSVAINVRIRLSYLQDEAGTYGTAIQLAAF